MIVINDQGFVENLLSKLGRKWTVYSFGGAVPATMAEFTFDPNVMEEINSNALSSVECDTVDLTEIVRFDQDISLKSAPGYNLDSLTGLYTLYPKGLKVNTDYATAKLTPITNYAMCSNYADFATNPLCAQTGRASYEFEYAYDVTPSKMYFKPYSSLYYSASQYRLEFWNGSSWELSKDFTITSADFPAIIEIDVTTGTSSKWRLSNLDNGGNSTIYSWWVQFATPVEPTTPNAITPITWFIAAPIAPETVVVDEVGTPIIMWGDAGGPNGLKAVAFSKDSAVSTEDVDVMNFQIRATDVGDFL